jgi:hypothetical protein
MIDAMSAQTRRVITRRVFQVASRQQTVAEPDSDLTGLMGVGAAVARYLRRAGISHINQLVGQEPIAIFDRMCAVDGRRHDPCLLDTVMSAVDQAEGQPARPWWQYTARRKQLLEGRTASGAHTGRAS